MKILTVLLSHVTSDCFHPRLRVYHVRRAVPQQRVTRVFSRFCFRGRHFTRASVKKTPSQYLQETVIFF